MQFSEYTVKKVKYTDAIIADSFEKHFGKSFKTVTDFKTKKGYFYDSPNHYYLDFDDNEYIFNPETGKWSYKPSHSESFYNTLFANIEGKK